MEILKKNNFKIVHNLIYLKGTYLLLLLKDPWHVGKLNTVEYPIGKESQNCLVLCEILPLLRA